MALQRLPPNSTEYRGRGPLTRGFTPRFGRPYAIHGSASRAILGYALVAQLVEHVLGKDGVTGSNPVEGSTQDLRAGRDRAGPDNYLFPNYLTQMGHIV